MAKRKEPDTPTKAQSTSSKKRRKEVSPEELPLDEEDALLPSTSPSKKARSNGTSHANGTSTPQNPGKKVIDEEHTDEDGDATPRPNGKTLFATPRRRGRPPKDTPTRGAKADRSAKRKSAQALVEAQEEDWDHSAALAQEILEDEENVLDSTELDTVTVQADSAPVTPSKRGRPKGAKNKRSPTPEGDLPPEERYFFQNRAGPPRVSSNVFSSLGLLTHDEYFEQIRKYKDHHDPEKAYLMKLHARSFLQWKFVMDQGYGVCMYGYGSKRELVNRFAEWLHPTLAAQSSIVVLNGYTSRINLRSVLNTVGSALVGKDEEMKLIGQPHDMIDTIFSHLTNHFKGQLILMINSIDSSSLRKASIQSVLARLASHPQINIVATADTPTFPILWNSTLRDQFQFMYHDCTTFAPYDIETNPVDDVNELLGRKNRRAGGKEGIGFVLKSLPENARNLYRVLLTEILTVVNDGGGDAGDDEEAEDGAPQGSGESAAEVGIEYRTLYQKALEEFICSSDMNFRFLLKEFHDHQMLTTRRDTSGTESLGVPLSREEMEAVLEDLVIG